MDINELKCELFTDLQSPMDFLEHKGLQAFDTPDSAKAFGSSVYFYTKGKEWLSKTPDCRVMISNINDFSSQQHKLVLDCPNDWQQTQNTILEKAARMAYENKLLKKACQAHATFESFWAATRKPKMLSLQTECYSKRGRRKYFIPLFDAQREVTGKVRIERGAIVQAVFRWELSESVDNERIHVGFRPKFASGLCIQTLGGDPTPIRAPWSWIDVDFEHLCMPMYKSLIVKMPCMTITNVIGSRATVTPPETFEKAIQDFHALAMADPWNKQITLHSRATVGERLMASVKPCQNNTDIEWVVVKHRLLPPRLHLPEAAADAVEAVEAVEAGVEAAKKPSVKRLSDNMDNSFDAKTKRQCILNGMNGHNIT